MKGPDGTPYEDGDYTMEIKFDDGDAIKIEDINTNSDNVNTMKPPKICRFINIPYCCNVDQKNGGINHDILQQYGSFRLGQPDFAPLWNPNQRFIDVIQKIYNHCFYNGGFDVTTMNGQSSEKRFQEYSTDISTFLYKASQQNYKNANGPQPVQYSIIPKIYESKDMYLDIIKFLKSYLKDMFAFTDDIIDNVLMGYVGKTRDEYIPFGAFLKHYKRTVGTYYDYYKQYGRIGFPLFGRTLTGVQFTIFAVYQVKIDDLCKLIATKLNVQMDTDKCTKDNLKLIWAGKNIKSDDNHQEIGDYNLSKYCKFHVLFSKQLINDLL